jgi:signal recognition particle receptor subunit beta
MELFKIMLAGDVSTGKTSFLTQLIYQAPDKNPLPNQTLTFFTLRITNPDACLQIWDSPGDPRFHYQVISSLSSFAVLLVFVDVTNSHTFNCAQTLLDGRSNFK